MMQKNENTIKTPKNTFRPIVDHIFSRFYLISFIFFLIFLFSSLLIVRNLMKEQLFTEVRYETEIESLSVNNWLLNSFSLCKQVSSRTRIRQELARYQAGETSFEELQDFTGPKLQDAIDYSDVICGITRLSAARQTIADLGIRFEPDSLRFWEVEDKNVKIADLLSDDGKIKIVIENKLFFDDSILIGYDYVCIDTRAIEEFLFEKDSSNRIGGSAIISSVSPHHQIIPTDILDPVFEQHIAHSDENNPHIPDLRYKNMSIEMQLLEFHPGWALLQYRHNSIFFDSVMKRSILLFIGFSLLFFLFMQILRRSFRPLNNDLIISEKELQTNIEMKTKELRSAMNDLIKSQNKLIAQEKHVVVGQISAGLAHDFNNLFNGFQSYIDILSADKDIYRKHKNYIDFLKKNIHQGALLVKKLLDYSQKGFRNLSDIDLKNELVHLLNDFKREKTGDKIMFVPPETTENITIHMDRRQFHDMIYAVLDNALKAGGEDDIVKIAYRTTTAESETCTICHEEFRGKYVRVDICDRGDGIPEHQRQSIFEPFYTTREVGEGSGLGLAQVRGILKQHNGHLIISDNSPSGSIFSIYLPFKLE